MSSLAYGRGAGLRRGRTRPTALIAAWGPDVLLGIALAVLALVLLAELNSDFGVDSWLQLVAGREIWQTGIPHHETLIAMAQGHAWVDQQWLSQLFGYALYRLGGLALLGLVNVALIVLPVTGAVIAARRAGAPFRSVLVVLPLCLALIIPAREIRTQELAMPLFVALVYLLGRDARRPSRQVLWCLPILALWANLHGSVTLGAGLVGLRGILLGWERRHELTAGVRAWRRPLALVLGAPLAIMLTPYGPAIVGYYRTTMQAGTLRQFVSEWQPITSSPGIAAVLFVLAAAVIWSFGRNPERTTTWEKLAFLVLVAGSISVVRNILFCGLFTLFVAPVSWGWGGAATSAPADRGRALVNGALALLAGLAVLGAVAAVAVRSDAAIQDSSASPKLLATLQGVTRADPSLRVLTDDRFADWLLWSDPALSGRIAYDVRYELLSAGQLSGLRSLLQVVGTNWRQGARGYRLLVLNRSTDADLNAFETEPGARVLYRHAGQVVILRTAAAAERE